MQTKLRQVIIISIMSLSLVASYKSFSQKAPVNESQLKKQANNYFEDEDYANAYLQYSQLLSLYPNDPNYNYRFGACMLFSQADKKKPIDYIETAVKQSNVDNLAYFYLGRAYHLNYRFDDAIKAYQHFRQNASSSDLKKHPVDRLIEMCNNGKHLLGNLHDLDVLRKKELSRSDYYQAYDLSSNGGTLLTEPDDFKTKTDKKKNLNSIIYLSPDRSRLFFSSYGDDDKNGKDIYVAYKLPNGAWGKPSNLGTVINTPYNEDYPFFDAPTNTLYFCSMGHNSMGGYDVFRSTYNAANNSWSTPVNMNFPINTPGDDILFIADTMNETAFFSSTRTSPEGRIAVYKINVQPHPPDYLVINGTTYNDAGTAVAVSRITVKDYQTGEVIGVFNSTSGNGSYTMNLANGGHFTYTVETGNHKTQTESVTLPLQIELTPLQQQIAYEPSTDRLLIKNLMQTSARDSNYLLSLDIIQKKADMEVNVDTNAPRKVIKQPVTQPLASNNSVATNATDTSTNEADTSDIAIDTTGKNGVNNNQLIQIAINDAKQQQQAAQSEKEEANKAIEYAVNKMSESQQLSKQAGEAAARADMLDDQQERDDTLAKAIHLKQQAQDVEKKSMEAFQYASQLEIQASVKQKEADQATQYTAKLDSALKSPNKEKSIKKLKAQRDSLQKQDELNAPTSPTAADLIRIQAQNTKQDSVEVVKHNEDLQKEADRLQQESDDYVNQAQKSDNPNEKVALLAQARDLTNSKKDKENEIKENQKALVDLHNHYNELVAQSKHLDSIVKTNPSSLQIAESDASDLKTDIKNYTPPAQTDHADTSHHKNVVAVQSNSQPTNKLQPDTTYVHVTNSGIVRNTTPNQNNPTVNTDTTHHVQPSNSVVSGNSTQNPTQTNPTVNADTTHHVIQSNPVVSNNSTQNPIQTNPIVNADTTHHVQQSNPVVSNNSTQNPTQTNPIVNTDTTHKAQQSNPVVSNNSTQNPLQANPTVKTDTTYPVQPSNPVVSNNSTQNTTLTNPTVNTDTTHHAQPSNPVATNTVQNNSQPTQPANTIATEQSSGQGTPPQSNIKYSTPVASQATQNAANFTKEATQLTSQAEDVRNQAKQTTDPKQARILSHRADSLDEAASEGNIVASIYKNEADGSQYLANQQQLSAWQTAMKNNPSDKVSTAQMLTVDANGYYEQSVREKQKADSTTVPYLKQMHLDESRKYLDAAIEKQQKAHDILLRVNPDLKNVTPVNVAVATISSPENNEVTNSEPANATTPPNATSASNNTNPVTSSTTVTNNSATTIPVQASSTGADTTHTVQSTTTPVTTNNSTAANTTATNTNTNKTTTIQQSQTNTTANNTVSPANNSTNAVNGQNATENNTNETTVAINKIDEIKELPRSPYSKAHPIPINPPLPEGLIYKVQIGAFNKPIAQNAFKGLEPIAGERVANGLTRYTAGIFKEFSKARDARAKVQRIGYRDAFIVAFYNGKRITIREASALQSGVQPSNAIVSVTPPANQGNASTQTNTNPATQQTGNPANPVVSTPVTDIKGIFYTVQVGAFKTIVSSDKLYNLTPLFSYKASNGYIRYNCGIYSSVPKASAAKDAIVGRTPIKDAFVVAYYNGDRVAITQAVQMLANGTAVLSQNPRLDIIPNGSNNGAERTSTTVNNTVPTNTTPATVTNNADTTGGKVTFTVQVGAYSGQIPIDVANNLLKIASQGITTRKEDGGITAYTVGSYPNYASANMLKSELVQDGFPGCFVVAYHGSKKISLKEAQSLINK